MVAPPLHYASNSCEDWQSLGGRLASAVCLDEDCSEVEQLDDSMHRWSSLGSRLAGVISSETASDSSDVEHLEHSMHRWNSLGSRLADVLRRAELDDSQEESMHCVGQARRPIAHVAARDAVLPEGLRQWKCVGSRLAMALNVAADDAEEEDAARDDQVARLTSPCQTFLASPAPSSILPTDASTAVWSDDGWSSDEDSCSDIDDLVPASPRAWAGLLEGNVNFVN